MTDFAFYEHRLSDSPYVESVARGHTIADTHAMRPAEVNWHMVFVKEDDTRYPILTGTFSSAGEIPFISADLLWIRFKLGVFMPHLSLRKNLSDTETELPTASCQSFWLNSATLEMPTYENADTFVNRLFADETLAYDSLIYDSLNNHQHDLSARTVRHRFLQATGSSQKHIEQVHRARQARTYLQQGKSILDTAYDLGYYDQSHLTKSLKQYIGFTPSEIIRAT